MAGRFVVREVDRGWDALRKAIKTIRQRGDYAKAGVLGSSKSRRGPGVSNVDLAVIHEFGSPAAGIPERSFIRSAFEANKAEYIADLRSLMKQVYEQKIDATRALGIVGAKMAADMKKGIVEGDGIPPPNTPEVFMRKLTGSAYARRRFNESGAPPRPLVDTGQMLNSITWAVVGRAGA